jgi:hypothetical protein
LKKPKQLQMVAAGAVLAWLTHGKNENEFE